MFQCVLFKGFPDCTSEFHRSKTKKQYRQDFCISGVRDSRHFFRHEDNLYITCPWKNGGLTTKDCWIPVIWEASADMTGWKSEVYFRANSPIFLCTKSMLSVQDGSKSCWRIKRNSTKTESLNVLVYMKLIEVWEDLSYNHIYITW